ncbi:hypothetical protein GALMADRAFT_217459 [Galerina marginata CBS 339.88]|uniref:Uncharacterized protein n=1 Tax=Galerina marginata (strain CBS 339.88) TaxID=685588 RepID=A0A067S6Y5_GALM3|nr:hypothetical protein GALMADRAFT_217459 [Galerina marginata CBS 339.88]
MPLPLSDAQQLLLLLLPPALSAHLPPTVPTPTPVLNLSTCPALPALCAAGTGAVAGGDGAGAGGACGFAEAAGGAVDVAGAGAGTADAAGAAGTVGAGARAAGAEARAVGTEARAPGGAGAGAVAGADASAGGDGAGLNGSIWEGRHGSDGSAHEEDGAAAAGAGAAGDDAGAGVTVPDCLWNAGEGEAPSCCPPPLRLVLNAGFWSLDGQWRPWRLRSCLPVTCAVYWIGGMEEKALGVLLALVLVLVLVVTVPGGIRDLKGARQGKRQMAVWDRAGGGEDGSSSLDGILRLWRGYGNGVTWRSAGLKEVIAQNSGRLPHRHLHQHYKPNLGSNLNCLSLSSSSQRPWTLEPTNLENPSRRHRLVCLVLLYIASE